MQLFCKENKWNQESLNFLGIPIYSKFMENGIITRKFLFGIFKKKSQMNQRKYYFLGIKILSINEQLTYKQMQYLLDRSRVHIIQGIQRSITTAILHQKTFSEFKNRHQGQTVVVVGAGPTLNQFKPIKDAIYVGGNRVFKHDKIKFDYLFAIDKAGLETENEQYYDDFLSYKGNNCIKFVGDQNTGEKFQIPESVILKYNVRRYKTVAGYICNKLSLDIDSEPLSNYCSVVLQALQFVLFTNPKRIYLVGVDCTTSSMQHFIGSPSVRKDNQAACDDYNIKGFYEIKQFIKTYYPDIEVISVNPVRLKGLFKDVYTDEDGNIIEN